jgi:cytochrome c oxidase subunit 4
MSEHSIEEMRKHVKVYIMVFLSLLILTGITVAVSYLHLPVHLAVIVALIVATVKGSLVALYFMHLISEKKMIYFTLVLTGVFFLVLMFLPVLTNSDHLGT